MLQVACVRWGKAFGVEYVERLHDMVRRNLADGTVGRFVCLTDDPEALRGLAGVETQLLPAGLTGWWNKLALFAPGTFNVGDQVLYFDLDTLVCGTLDKLAALRPAFAILRDAYRHDGFQSSVMSFAADTELTTAIWEEFQLRVIGPIFQPDQAHRWDPAAHWPGGDQEYLEKFFARSGYNARRIGGECWPPEILQDLLPGVLRSYKVECVADPPKGTSVVYFHGHPRPHEVLDGWVPAVWKVGGGIAAELVMVPNMPQETILARITSCAANPELDFLESSAPHDQLAVILGGGPSLKLALPQVFAMQRDGGIVLATNATAGFLRAHGMREDAQVICDAKPECVRFYQPGGKKLFASMVDPVLLQLAQADPDAELTVWHPLTEGAPGVLPEGVPLVGGGSTVGMRAIALAWGMGFRKFALFGFDSSYQDGQHHAYPQPENDGQRVLDAIHRGRHFKCAAWMVQQASEFRELAALMLNSGAELYVFGEGLVPWIAASMREPDEGFIQIDGTWWPARDLETRQAVLGTITDCRLYATLPKHRRVCVQAGGNVGVWPLELAAHFERVYTFEPDPENWECLTRNLALRPGRENIVALQEGLGAAVEHVKLQQAVGNPGATYVVREEGGVSIRTIDAMNLPHLDLLVLDIEGYEQLALEGAAATIERHHPVIVLELKGLGVRYGYTDDFTIAWLKARGYTIRGTAHRDVIFTRD